MAGIGNYKPHKSDFTICGTNLHTGVATSKGNQHVISPHFHYGLAGTPKSLHKEEEDVDYFVLAGRKHIVIGFTYDSGAQGNFKVYKNTTTDSISGGTQLGPIYYTSTGYGEMRVPHLTFVAGEFIVVDPQTNLNHITAVGWTEDA